MTAVLALVMLVQVAIPTQADLEHMAAVVCGEACGMPLAAQRLVAENVRRDWYRLGTERLYTRWHAYKEAGANIDLLRQVFAEPYRFPKCKLVGSKTDAVYWKANGYLPPDAVPDFSWAVLDGRYEVNAFGCFHPVVPVRVKEKAPGRNREAR